MRTACAVGVCLLLAAGFAPGEDAAKVTLKGTVVDADGNPVAAATVRLFEQVRDEHGTGYRDESRTTTAADGSFVVATAGGQRLFKVVALKEGLALGWETWSAEKDASVTIRLGKPEKLAGTVRDEAGAPIAAASLHAGLRTPARTLYQVPLEALATRTDAQGRFSFEGLPVESTVSLSVRVAGHASLTVTGPDRRGFPAGKTDVTIVLSPEARIEGTVVEKESGAPVAGVALRARTLPGGPVGHSASEVSAKDGTFRFKTLPAGRYLVTLLPPEGKPVERVAEPVTVPVEAGKTAAGLRIELIRGAIIEVAVTDAGSRRPVDDAVVRVMTSGEPVTTFTGRTDKDGIARVRVPPGAYRSPTVYKPGYNTTRSDVMFLVVGEGVEKRVDVRMGTLPKITGVVRDEAGTPVEGAAVRLMPYSGSEVRTQADGKFELTWDPGYLGSPAPQLHVLAQHTGRNLAALVEMPEDDETLDVKMAAAVTLAGRVVDPDGNPISGATLSVLLRLGRRSSTISTGPVVAGPDGRYEVRAVPPDEDYTVHALADGYGRGQVAVSAAAGEDRRMQADDIELPRTDKSVSGVVVDEDGNPVGDVLVQAYGEKQPDRRATTDAQGKFSIEKVCEGPLIVLARVQGGNVQGYSRVAGGDKDVKVVLRKPETRVYVEPPKVEAPVSLVGKPLPKPDDLNVKLDAGQTKDRSILVCFWDMNQRPSRHCVRELAARAEELAKKDVTVVLVHAAAADATALGKLTDEWKLPFPVGTPAGDAEKTLASWGVRGLPWLILTDRGHVVRAEGFSLESLDDKLRQVTADGK